MSSSAIISTAVNTYISTFSSYFGQFLKWGEEFFFASLTITIAWMCLWNAFDKGSFSESMPKFIKEFFIIALFYTLMLYAKDWLATIPKSAQVMGQILGNMKVDPSSIIDQGIAVANRLSQLPQSGGLFDKMYASIVLAFADVAILFVFISIALELAVTTLIIYFFISISGFSLAFAVFPFTRDIARRTLDIVIGNSMKLASLYLIVAAGSGIFNQIVEQVQNGSNDVFTAVDWSVAAAFLFWLVCKNIPSQVARIFSYAVQETRGTSAAALALSAVHNAQTAVNAARLAGQALKPIDAAASSVAKVAGSTMRNAYTHGATTVGGIGSRLASAMEGGAKDLAGSAWGSLADHAKHLGSKLSGGKGMVDERGNKNIPGVAQRMHAKAMALRGIGVADGEGSNSIGLSKNIPQASSDSNVKMSYGASMQKGSDSADLPRSIPTSPDSNARMGADSSSQKASDGLSKSVPHTTPEADVEIGSYSSSTNIRTEYPSAGAPTSAGRKSAGPSSTRSESCVDNISRPKKR